jgi:hypothetical protein
MALIPSGHRLRLAKEFGSTAKDSQGVFPGVLGTPGNAAKHLRLDI